jgi:hypothetical protein
MTGMREKRCEGEEGNTGKRNATGCYLMLVKNDDDRLTAIGMRGYNTKTYSAGVTSA